ncbi:MAG: hypothetical protein RI907_3138 [Pseudomonadota bacterium]|jgi:uncharacterized membrane protein YhaH (DUF805 family)
MRWFILALQKYATFSGRARRQEFWHFMLISMASAIGLLFIDFQTHMVDHELGMGTLSGIFVLATFLPSMAVSVRRLHDLGKSGWWWLVSLVPYLGVLVLLFMCAQPGQYGANEYGEDPIPGT